MTGRRLFCLGRAAGRQTHAYIFLKPNGSAPFPASAGHRRALKAAVGPTLLRAFRKASLRPRTPQGRPLTTAITGEGGSDRPSSTSGFSLPFCACALPLPVPCPGRAFQAAPDGRRAKARGNGVPEWAPPFASTPSTRRKRNVRRG